MDAEEKEKLRLGFVGGGPGSLIGPIRYSLNHGSAF